jgi:2-polyprenyl-3-methyl-5-hydroxy-6-metoxy-1,4-benzoquinol methylase
MNQKCIFCKERTEYFLSTKDYNRKKSNLKFQYNRCLKCKTINLVNIPNDINKFYTIDYHNIKDKKLILRDNKSKIQYLLNLNLKKKDAILDIGSSYGEFLYCAKVFGYKPEGFDLSADAARYTIKNFNIKTHVGISIKDLKKKYNLITMWQSLEHFKNPKSTINQLISKVKMGGYVILSLPNPCSLGFKLFKSKWPHLDAPRHSYLIESQYLVSLFLKKKFRLILKTSNDLDSKYNNRISYSILISNFYNKKNFFNLNKLHRYFLNIIGLIIEKILFFFENKNFQGSCYTLIFKKI